MNESEKLDHLRKKLADYEEILTREMKGYRGVIHESASSELKHSKVMVIKAIIQGLKKEIQQLENTIS